MKTEIIKKAAIGIMCLAAAAGSVNSYMEGLASDGIEIEYGSYDQSMKELSDITTAEITIDESEDAKPAAVAEDTEAESIEDIKTAQASEKNGLVNINTASEEELQSLKGIGPTKAQAIIDYRDAYGYFVSIEEITEVKGIGEGTFNKIKDSIIAE